MKHKLMLLAALVAGAAGCDSSGNKKTVPENTIPTIQTAVDPTIDTTVITFNDLPVHDPSVIKVEEQVTTGEGDAAVTTTVDAFYVFGSHLAAARSTDLMNWTHISAPAPVFGDLTNSEGNVFNTGVNFADNPLFPDYATELSDAVAYTGGVVGSWASDVIQLTDGRYYFYYNHCANPLDGNCNSSRSYLGLAVSDSIQGPYTDLGVFLHSGQTEAEMALPEYQVGDLTAYDGNIHPNTIDPDVFYDKNGNLWMVYGSYSGGIFILAMDETTGFPEPDQGYGTHLVGGFYSAIEGPYILYSPETDYYYLFTSFGGFLAGDGYNIRVSRSRNPNGPFLDANGNDMVSASGNWESIEPYGVKLMGGFNFPTDVGEDKTSRGYLAPGHNSAYYDTDTGEYFLITHTRFPNMGEGHSIRVHEMYINEDDWLVVSPQRYTPIDGGNIVDRDDLFGDWQIVNHEQDINRGAKQAVYVSLTNKGEITGDAAGSYYLDSDNPEFININLGSSGFFKGVMKWQWDPSQNALLPTFTALNSNGESLWGVKLPEKTPDTVIQDIEDALVYPDTLAQNFIDLPTQGTRGAEITWETSDINVIKPDGTVLRPAAGEMDGTVTLTANIERNGLTSSKSVTMTVLARKDFNRIAQYDFENDLTDTLGNFDAARQTGDRIWKIDEGTVAYAAGYTGQAVQLDGVSNGVRLPDGLISNYEYTVSMWVNPVALNIFTTTFFGASGEIDNGDGTYGVARWSSLLTMGWDAGTAMLWGNNEGVWFDGLTGTTIPTETWSHMAYSVNQGVVTVMINGVSVFSGGTLGDYFTDKTGLFGLGVNNFDAPFNGLIDDVKIYEAALSPDEVLALDVNGTPASELLASAVGILDLGDISAVKEDLYLPVSGPYASAIAWSSSDPSTIEVIADEGRITRPPRDTSDATVTLTATVTLAGEQQVKEFVVTVSSLSPPEPVAQYSFEDDLTDSTGNFAAGRSIGALIDSAETGTYGFAAGVIGQALLLDGTSGIRLGDDIIKDTSYSVSTWLNPTTAPIFTTAFFAGTPENWISISPAGNHLESNFMFWMGGPWQTAGTGAPAPTGTWSHLAAVYLDGAVTVYLNGEEVFTGTGFIDRFSASAAGTPWAIGVNYWDTPYNGLIDELRIYDETLTADDVAELYQAGVAQ